jgi:hypothetical protein
MAESDAVDLLDHVLGKAKQGDMQAATLVLQRIWPPRRGRPLRFDLPALNTTADLPRAVAAIVNAVSDGTLSPDEAQSIAAVLEQHRRAIETVELEQRIAALEEAVDRS